MCQLVLLVQNVIEAVDRIADLGHGQIPSILNARNQYRALRPGPSARIPGNVARAPGLGDMRSVRQRLDALGGLISQVRRAGYRWHGCTPRRVERDGDRVRLALKRKWTNLPQRDGSKRNRASNNDESIPHGLTDL